MATREEQEAARLKVETAERALENHKSKHRDVDADPALYRRLSEELQEATAEFLETMK